MGETCPVFLMSERVHAFRLLTMFDHGFLPRSGGWEDQDAIVIDQIEIVTAARSRVDAERAAERAAGAA